MPGNGYTSGSQSVVPGPVASVSPGNANSPGPAPDLHNQALWSQGPNILTSLLRGSNVPLKFENH